MSDETLRDMVVLENSVIDAMMSNPEAKREFSSCFRHVDNAPAPAAGCSRCSQRSQEARRLAYQQCRACLAALADSQKVRLKQFLGAKKVRIIYPSGVRSVKLTF